MRSVAAALTPQDGSLFTINSPRPAFWSWESAVRIASSASCKPLHPAACHSCHSCRSADELRVTHHTGRCYDLVGVLGDSTLQLTIMIIWTPSSVQLSTGSALRLRQPISPCASGKQNTDTWTQHHTMHALAFAPGTHAGARPPLTCPPLPCPPPTRPPAGRLSRFPQRLDGAMLGYSRRSLSSPALTCSLRHAGLAD
jgi:hypothetical protein